MANMGTNGTRRGTDRRPSAEEVSNPQMARENVIRRIFREQHKFLAALFPKDGATFVARSLSSAIRALKMRDKNGALALEKIAPEMIAEKCIACHHMGLEPVTEAYLIPYGNDLQIITAPKGLIKLMYNAGWIVEARAVREGDLFEHEMGDNAFIKHRKASNRRSDDGAVTFGYAFARHRDGGPTVREVFARDDIEAHGPMWSDNYEGATRKTMIHAIAEFLPLPAAVMSALSQNEAGGVEISEEIMALLREAKAKPETPPATNSAPEVEQAPPVDADRGQEGAT